MVYANQEHNKDNGSGTVLCAGVMSATLLLAGTCAAAAVAHRAATATRIAADLAALAAASTAANDPADQPCHVAANIAAAGGSTLTSCTVESNAVATVTVKTAFNHLPVPVTITRTARAGPIDVMASHK